MLLLAAVDEAADVVIGGDLPIFYMIAALVAVPESRAIGALLEAAARSLACYSSPRLYFSRRTVRFLGELQIKSN